MRYDERVFFVREIPGEYNPETGDYEESCIFRVMFPADVTDAGDKTVQFIYGEARTGCIVIRIKQPLHSHKFDYIEYNGRKYHADKIRRGLLGLSYVCSEVL